MEILYHPIFLFFFKKWGHGETDKIVIETINCTQPGLITCTYCFGPKMFVFTDSSTDYLLEHKWSVGIDTYGGDNIVVHNAKMTIKQKSLV